MSVLVALCALALVAPACAVVPRYRRAYVADPAMAGGGADALEQRALRKLRVTREAAAGGDGLSAGGGCACGN